MTEQLDRTVSLGVESEVGTLRKVMVHRPGLEHTRLTPTNAEELLFDDVIWVKRAKEEHDAFVSVMRDRGVEVLYAEQLLTDVLEMPEAREWVLDRVLDERHVGVYLARSRHEWGRNASAREVADFLIGGITKRDLAEGEGLTYESSELSDMLLPPLPNFLFQRDPSCWIYDGVTLNPMAKAARRPETVFMEAIYRWHPMFAHNGGVKVWHGGVEQDWGRATVEGGDVMPIGNGAVMIGMGERTAPQAVTMIARELFKAGSARLVLAVMLPRSRHYMHLDTVMTMVDRDTVTLFPEVVDGARVWSIRPGATPELPVVERFGGGVIDALEDALGVEKMRAIADRRRLVRERARAVGRREQPAVSRAGRGRRLRPQRRHQHAAAQGRDRGDHRRRIRARPRPRRLSLHELPDPARPGVLTRCTTCATAASSRRSTSPRGSSSIC